MRRITAWMRARIALLSIAAGLIAMPAAMAHAAENAAVQNPEVAKYLSQAQKLSGKQQWGAALAAVKKAQGVPRKSAYAEYKIDEFMAYLLTQQKRYSEAAVVFERMAASSQASATARRGHLKTAAQLYYQAPDYQRAATVARRALAQRPGDVQLLEMIAQAEYQAGEFKKAAATLRDLVASTQKQGAKPEESWLQMLLSSYDRLQDRSSMNQAWELLLREYPKPEYWRAVLAARSSGRQPANIELGYQRLMFDLGMLTDPADFEDLALGAIDAGAPGEAVRVLEAGLQQKILSGEDEGRFRRMLDYAKDQASQRHRQLEELAQNAQRASGGQLSMALGRLHLGEARYDEAAAALRQGLGKGNLRDAEQGRIELGIALLKSHQVEQARKAFASVGEQSQWRDLAELWSLRAQTQGSFPG